jgi:hypothetical protein
VLEFGVGLDDGVGADDEVFGEGADAGELVAVAQDAGFGGVLDLLHKLEVEGVAEGGVEFLEEHGVSVYGYSVMEVSGRGQGGLGGGRSKEEFEEKRRKKITQRRRGRGVGAEKNKSRIERRDGRSLERRCGLG